MSKKLDLVGKKFGRLVVIKETIYKGLRAWACQCDCGEKTIVTTSNLTNGHTNSCGCIKREVTAKTHTKHGMCGTPTYRSWESMLNRCNNKNGMDFSDYGGRGIKVCERWKDFSNFYSDMGERPEGTSIDRINVNGDYEPSNCRWATMKEQANNKRTNHHLTFRGLTLTISQWSTKLGLKREIIKDRLMSGWSIEDALTKKVRA